MTTVAVLETDLILNSAAFRAGMVRAAETANSALGQIRVEARQTAASIDMMSKAAEAFVGFEALKSAGESLIEAQVQLQQIHYTLISATGSANAAGSAFKWLQQQSQQLGLNLQPSAQGFAQLAAAANASGISLSQVKELFTAYAKAQTVMHLTSEQSQHALLALTEMMSRGTIQSRQLNQQLGFAIPGSAGRFKAAVEKMVAGTDLAGKSFMALEKHGELVTAKFMPALIQALNESGRGYQDAAQGLNAEINRLKTAWFDLKTNVSGGLFNSAATESIKVMAANLQNLADVASIAGGVALSRLIGARLGAGVGSLSQSLAARTAAKEQAASEFQLAEATVAETAAQVKNTQAALAGVTAVRDQAFAARQAAASTYEAALADNAAAQAAMEHLRSAATLSANLRAQAMAEEEAVAAQLALTRAQAQYDAAIAASNTLKEQQIALEGRLIEVKSAAVVATEAQAAAQARLAEMSIGSTITAGLNSAKGALMGLVGGPWGLAITLAGALGYSFYSLYEDSAKVHQAFVKEISDLQAIPAHLQDVVTAYKALGSTQSTMSFLEDWKQANDQIQRAQQQIGALKQNIADMQKMQDGPQFSGAGSGLRLQLGGQIKAAKEQLAQLEQQVAPTRASFMAMSSTLRSELGPAFDAVIAKARTLNGEDFKHFFDSLDAGTRQAITDAGLMRTAFASDLTAIDTMQKQFQSKIDNYGKNSTQRAQLMIQQQVAAIQKMNAPAAVKAQDIAAIEKEGQALISTAHGWDTLQHSQQDARKASEAYRAEMRSYNTLFRQVREGIAEERAQLDGTDKLTAAEKLRAQVLQKLADGEMRLSPLQRQRILDSLATYVAVTKQADAERAHNRELEKETALQKQLDDALARQTRQNDQRLQGLGHGSAWNAEEASMRKIGDEAAKVKAKLLHMFDAGQISAAEYNKQLLQVGVTEQQMLVQEQRYYQERNAMMGDWRKGAVKAFEDYQTKASDVLGQTAAIFTKAFDGMSNSLAQFIVTGKANFASLATSIIQDIIRMELQAAESKILGSVFPSLFGSPSSSDSTTSLMSFIGMGSGNSFSFASLLSGGRANGGPVGAGSLYQVNENGPELLTTGGATYLMMGAQDGTVTPTAAGAPGAAAGSQPVVNVNITGAPSQPSISTSRGADGSINIEAHFETMLANSFARRGKGAQAMEHVYGIGRPGQSYG